MSSDFGVKRVSNGYVLSNNTIRDDGSAIDFIYSSWYEVIRHMEDSLFPAALCDEDREPGEELNNRLTNPEN